MIIEYTKASDLKTSSWSGGTTTQLDIYPENAEYKKRNFLFRLSTASVECEESTFTKLPEISRKLMILNGEIKIEHETQYSKTIKKFEQDEFSGSWDTKSYGKAIDFNLMTTGKVSGEIEAFSINKSINLNLIKDYNYYGFYLYTGKLQLQINSKVYPLLKGDFLAISLENTNQVINIATNSSCELILTKIKL